jgi:hypothetical protein
MQRRREMLDRWKVRIVILDAAESWELILAYLDAAVWVPIYFDGQYCIMAEPVDDYTRLQVALINDAVAVLPPADDTDDAKAREASAQGRIVFPDAVTALRTAALFLASPRLEGDEHLSPQDRVGFEAFKFRLRSEAVIKAQQARPTALLYSLLDQLARARPEPKPDLRAYYENERERLKTLPTDVAEGAEVLRCRLYVESLLARRYREAGDERKALAADEEVDRLGRSIQRLAAWWQF